VVKTKVVPGLFQTARFTTKLITATIVTIDPG
jgi:hypothetical protein